MNTLQELVAGEAVGNRHSTKLVNKNGIVLTVNDTGIYVSYKHIEDKNENDSRIPKGNIAELLGIKTDSIDILIFDILSAIYGKNGYSYTSYLNSKDDFLDGNTLKEHMDTSIKAKAGGDITKVTKFEESSNDFYKFSKYRLLRSKDLNKYYILEAILGLQMTYVTYAGRPFANIDFNNDKNYHIWRDIQSYNNRGKEDKIVKRNYDMFDLEHLEKYVSPVIFVAGYATWVKQVDSNCIYQHGPEYRMNGKKEDLYTSHNHIPHPHNHIRLRSANNSTSWEDISSVVATSLEVYELQRKKN